MGGHLFHGKSFHVPTTATEKNPLIILDLVGRVFPGACQSSLMSGLVDDMLVKRGFTPDNTLFATSVCPDEINQQHGDLAALFHVFWGEHFPLGGLAGVPFVGKEGFKAFMMHVPKGGKLFVLVASHVGVLDTGEGAKFGKYIRNGQDDHESATCGAAMGAYGLIADGLDDLEHDKSLRRDLQFKYLFHELKEKMQGKRFTDPGVAVPQQMHDICKEFFQDIREILLHEDAKIQELGGTMPELALLTGIQINMPHPHEDRFQPLTFQLYDERGNPAPRGNLLPQLLQVIHSLP